MNESKAIAEEAITIGLEDLKNRYVDFVTPTKEEVRQAAERFCLAYERSQKLY